MSAGEHACPRSVSAERNPPFTPSEDGGPTFAVDSPGTFSDCPRVSRGDSLARQLRLWMLLEERRELSVQDAVRALDATARTVYRDLEVLQRAGMPIYPQAQGRRRRWTVDPGYQRRVALTLTSQEAMALVAARSLLVMLEGTVFASAAQGLSEKLRTVLPAPLRTRVDALAPRVTARSGPQHAYAARRDVVDRLFEATGARQVTRLSYRKLGQAREEVHLVEPHHLHFHAGALYIIGWSRTRGGPRLFLLDRVVSAEITADEFLPRAEVEPSRFIHGAFGVWDGPPESVVLRFRGPSASLVAEQKWHASQVSRPCEAGELEVSFEVPRTPALVGWVRSFGDQVRVVRPRRLLKDV